MRTVHQILVVVAHLAVLFTPSANADDDNDASGDHFFLLFRNFFGRFCFHNERCGFWRLGKIMSRNPRADDDEEATTECEQICTYFSLFASVKQYQCGACPEIAPSCTPSQEPSVVPSAQPSLAPSSLPTAPLPDTEYNVYLDLEAGVPIADQSLFVNAAARWEEVVVGDLSDIVSQQILDLFPGEEGLPPAGCEYPTLIDDLYVCATYKSVDGPGGVLASAAPTFWRTPSFLTITGAMVFDTADILALKAGGNFANVILHEMGHILGMYSIVSKTSLQQLSSVNPFLLLTCYL